mmetsp:Transcript_11101/g.29259  ORF Transcript_11101/g.29259 Transcript_11101/m.29259 type:complete len:93 (-) Transcript_11101:125-403(-)
MAAGAIAVAHDSGGVRMDIVDHGVTGFLAGPGPESYAEAVIEATVRMGPEMWRKMQIAAREKVARFSDERFREEFMALMVKIPCIAEAMRLK